MTSPLPSTPLPSIEKELIDTLAGLPTLWQPASRSLLLRRLRERLYHQVQIADFPGAREQAVAIVAECLGDPVRMVTLVDVVELFVPELPALSVLRRLQHECLAIDVLPAEDWQDLRRALQAIKPANPGLLYQHATSHQHPVPPAWCTTAWDMFIHLAGRNALPGGLPSDLVFLLRLADEVDSATATLIRHRNQRRATRLGVTAALHQHWTSATAGGEPPETFVYLVIVVDTDYEPRGDDIPRYVLSYYRQWKGGGDWHSQKDGKARGVLYRELEDRVAAIVRQMEEDWHTRHETVVVELVLPLDLLNEDVPWWRKEKAADLMQEKVLALDYPVVVRSLDRLKRRDWHRPWWRRWQRMQSEPVSARLHLCAPADHDFTRLEAELQDAHDCTSLLLSRPPTAAPPHGLREVGTALRAGLPVIVWHGAHRPDPPFQEEIRKMTGNGNITRLPRLAWEARLAALRAGASDRANHLGRHLSVLWDDPERTPELDPPYGTEGVAGL